MTGTSSTSHERGARRRPYFWETFTPGDSYAARNVAALRTGVDREPGALPMALHRVRGTEAEEAAGTVSAAFAAEHVALTLFGVHQQGQTRTVHQSGVGLGTACRALRGCGQVSPIAVDRRMDALAGALDQGELAHHLRPLVQQLRGAAVRLDYTRLFFDLLAWQQAEPEHERRVRAWGLQYTDLARTDPAAPGPFLRTPDEKPPYWERYTPVAPRAAAELAALRAGADRAAGTVPGTWNLYRAEVSPYEQTTGALGSRLATEHTVLVLFGLHQHGRRKAMHAPGVGLGEACARLRASGRGSAEALERRFGNILTSVDGHELGRHLRGLVPLLRTADQPLDYGRLQSDLRGWDIPDERTAIRGGQNAPAGRTAIRSRWDRAFHSTRTPSPG
ncbi:type I-E CRISPR-associated protein Cse2/CasB [Streptomyces sp. NPDC001985]|uniref:type I-E CRISPR-associated protein Cse2/CasB n=1 Tax=Streptomyces sp. NPDC001985 TaxID=3154406 RepID=UPI0033230AAD